MHLIPRGASYPALDRPLLTEGDGGGVHVGSFTMEELVPGDEDELRSAGLQTDASSQSTKEQKKERLTNTIPKCGVQRGTTQLMGCR